MKATRRCLAALLWACSAITQAAPQPLPAGHELFNVEHGGRPRSFVLHLPPAATAEPTRTLPLVVMLHGMGGTAANAVRETGWSALADKEAFIVAYADASRPKPKQPPHLRKNPQAWNDGSGRFHAGQEQVDDVGFVRALIDHLSAAHAVDKRRVYVTGFSNGAAMAFKVGHELAERVAAIAPVAGSSWDESPKPSRGLSLLYLTGTADPLNPMAGGFPKLAFGGGEQGGRAKVPVQEMLAKWAAALRCRADPAAGSDNDGVHTRRFVGCRDGAEVVIITVDGLGHIWPGGENLLPEFVVGKPTNKLKATEVIWEFFRTHAMP
jgi:polyhydroxybutyrate depolymerase